MRKLIKCKLEVNGAIDGRSRKAAWLKRSSNNRAETARDLISKAVQKHVSPLQVRGSMGAEDGLLVTCVMLMRSVSRNSYIGGRSDYGAKVENFLRECNTMVKDHLLKQFRNLECLGVLKATENFDI